MGLRLLYKQILNIQLILNNLILNFLSILN